MVLLRSLRLLTIVLISALVLSGRVAAGASRTRYVRVEVTGQSIKWPVASAQMAVTNVSKTPVWIVAKPRSIRLSRGTCPAVEVWSGWSEVSEAVQRRVAGYYHFRAPVLVELGPGESWTQPVSVGLPGYLPPKGCYAIVPDGLASPTKLVVGPHGDIERLDAAWEDGVRGTLRFVVMYGLSDDRGKLTDYASLRRWARIASSCRVSITR